MQTRIVAVGLKVLLATVVILVGLKVGPDLGLALLWLSQHDSSQCGLRETMRIKGFLDRLGNANKQITASRRLLKTDGDLQLWDVPGARSFWLYRKFDKLNAFAFAEQIADEYWHPEVHVQPGDVVLDCGADYGSVTWNALRAGASKVVAIEIAPEKSPCLRRTFAKEIAEGRVAVVPVGVWDHDDTVELGADSVVLQQNVAKRTVPVTTIDKIVSTLNLTRVDFIAMDIEGAEKRALRGAEGTLRKFRPRIATAAEHYADDSVAIPKLIHQIVPDYRTICGGCRIQANRIVSKVLFFHPR